jgi:hypothetical protein
VEKECFIRDELHNEANVKRRGQILKGPNGKSAIFSIFNARHLALGDPEGFA